MTDSGRPVYGGGGITPDVKVTTPKQNRFQDELLQHYAFFNFAKRYVINHKVPKIFEVDDQVMSDFRKFLDEQKIAYTEVEMQEVNDWLRSNIKTELFIDSFGQQEGLKVRAESDPQVQKAIEMLPKAKELAENARRVIAERSSAREAASSNR